jgi:hypothetical protein
MVVQRAEAMAIICKLFCAMRRLAASKTDGKPV